MNTTETAALSSTAMTQISTDGAADFSVFNNTSHVIYLKYTTAQTQPTDKLGAIKLLPGQTHDRGGRAGYLWAQSSLTGVKISITQ